MLARPLALSIALATFAVLSPAQSGVLDQVSPFDVSGGPLSNAQFNADAASLTWQAQVRAGLAGTLEGFTLRLEDPTGPCALRVALRMGPVWNTTPALIDRTISTPSAGVHDVFVDVTNANAQVTPGTLFVIELQGTSNGARVHGTYAPPPNTPAYPEPLYLNGSGFAGGEWRIGFQTFVHISAGASFCSGDGTGTDCPCGNNASAGRGCGNSLGAGAQLTGAGTASVANDAFVLTVNPVPNSSVLFFQGTTQIGGGAGTVFGDGLRCAGGTVSRLGTQTAGSNTASYPRPGDVPISVKGAIPPAGAVRTYQAWYRNAADYCTSATFNLSNGWGVVWAP